MLDLVRELSSPTSVPRARLELPLLDPQVVCELWLVSAQFFDQALGVLAAYERLDASPSGWSALDRMSTIA